MKSKYWILTASALISVSAFAQKEELKEAERQLRRGNLAESQTALTQAASVIESAQDADKAKYYYIKAELHLELAKKKNNETANLVEASKAYITLNQIETQMGKLKLFKESAENILTLRSELMNSAVKDNQEQQYKDASAKLHSSYMLNKNDTIHLYYAASSAVQGQDFDLALEYYKELAKLGFTGKSKMYTAVNKTTNEVDNFGFNPTSRDLAVKAGSHTNPQVVKEESKRGEIVKNIALIYNQKGDIENAKKAIYDARKENPDDVSLIVTEANMYLEAKEMDKYHSLIKEAVTKDPDNADLYYNLGVVSANAKDLEAAKANYLKAIALNPKMENAYINLASVLLDGEKAIVEKMNKLGNSAADNAKYDELKKKREDIFKSTIPYLDKVLEINPSNAEAGMTLANIYSVLGDYTKAKALKAKFAK